MHAAGLCVRLLATRLRQGRASSLLVVLVLATAGAAATSAVLLREAATGAWDRAVAATYGADLHVARFGDLDAGALSRLPGVVESSAPVVSTVRQLRAGGQSAGVALAAIAEDLRIDRPLVVEGGWRPGALVVERSFARALGVGVGDMVDVSGRSLAVSGIAVSVRNAGYPASVPGTAFTDPSTAAALEPGGQRLTTVGLRVREGTEEAVASAASRYGMVTTAAAVRAEALDRTRQFQVVLASFSTLLLASAGFLVVVLLGARLRAQRRELVVLRLIGLTPAQVVGLIAAEHALLAGAGGVLGAAVAVAGGRRLTEAAAGALNSTSPRPGLSVLAVIVALVGATAAVAAIAARRPAAAGLAGLAASAPVRPSRAGARALAAGLPAPVALVAKEVSSNRARAAAVVAAVALAVMSAVAALGMEATFRSERTRAAARALPAPDLPSLPAAGSDEAGLRTLVYGLEGVLAVVALAAIVAVGLVGVRERRRELAVLSAIGFSVRQLAGSTVAGHAMLAGLGAVAGVPLGLGFFRLAYALANGSSSGLVDAPLLHLVAVVPVTILVAGLVATFPAASLRRLPVAAALSPA